MTDTETRVLALIRAHWGPAIDDFVDPLDARLINDLKADSLDVVDLTMAVEDDFGIQILDDEMEPFAGDDGHAGRTVRDFCAMVDGKLGKVAP